jgi:hypothetical protein
MLCPMVYCIQARTAIFMGVQYRNIRRVGIAHHIRVSVGNAHPTDTTDTILVCSGGKYIYRCAVQSVNKKREYFYDKSVYALRILATVLMLMTINTILMTINAIFMTINTMLMMINAIFMTINAIFMTINAMLMTINTIFMTINTMLTTINTILMMTT